jgi:hypothetical protein
LVSFSILTSIPWTLLVASSAACMVGTGGGGAVSQVFRRGIVVVHHTTPPTHTHAHTHTRTQLRNTPTPTQHPPAPAPAHRTTSTYRIIGQHPLDSAGAAGASDVGSSFFPPWRLLLRSTLSVSFYEDRLN